MKKKNAPANWALDWAIRFVFCILYANALTLAAAGGLSIVTSSFTVILITTFAAACFFLMFGFPKFSKIVLFVFLGLLGAGIITFGVMCLVGSIDYNALYSDIMDIMGGYKRIDARQSRIIVIIISVVLSLLSAFFLSRKVLFAACAATAFVMFILQQLTGNIYSYGYFAFLTYIVIVMGVYSAFLRFEKASGGQDFGYKRLAVLGFCIVCSVAVLIMTLIAPFGNTYSKSISIEDLNPNAFNNRGQGYFHLASAGVGTNDAYLGDTLTLNFNDVFELTSDNPLYVVATYNDTYTGTGWKVGDSMTTKYADDPASEKLKPTAVKFNEMFKDSDVVELDTMMKLNALDTAGIEYSVNNVGIKFSKSDEYFRSVLRSADLIDVSKPDKRMLWNDITYNLYTNLYFRNGLSYKFSSLNYDLMSLYDYLRSDAYGDGISLPPTFSKSAVKTTTDYVYGTCLKLPENVPPRVSSLAERIVADSGAASRMDKVWALMEYMWRYDYRINVDSAKNGTDFVDSFLFGDSDTDEPSDEYYGGYCTGFASSLAVMCRSLGIPARYVEGFSPLSQAGESLTVNNSYAHSWTEVYFDGVGWVMFEPTTHDAEALYGVNTEDYAIIKDEPEEPEEDEPEDEPDDESQPTESDPTSSETSVPDIPPAENDNSIGNSVVFENEGGFKLTVKDLVIILCILAGLALLIMIPTAIVNARKRQMARVLTLKNKPFVLVMFRELSRTLKFVGVKRDKDETVHEFISRVADLCGDQKINGAAESFDKALYSEEAVLDNDRAYAQAAYNACNAYAMAHSKRWLFNINRYLLHRM